MANESLEATQQRLKEQLLTNFTGSIPMPKINIFDQKRFTITGKSFQNGQPSSLVISNVNGVLRIIQPNDIKQFLGSQPIGIEQIAAEIHRIWLNANNQYQAKKNGSYSGSLSKAELRRDQEFWLSLYYNVNDIRKNIRSELNDILNQSNNIQELMVVNLEILEIEREQLDTKKEINEARNNIIQRNLALYILPAIGLLILGYFIYKRKIKL